MDRINKKPIRIISIVIALAVAFALLSLLSMADPFSYWLRPLITNILGLTGLTVENHADFFKVGELIIPWTRDCAGINLVLFLWALIAWLNREQYTTKSFWLRILLAVPVALVANIGRIFTLIAYRWIAYPATESSAMHYFLGFIWILPFLKPLVVMKHDSKSQPTFIEVFYVMAVLSLAAQYIGSPGGNLVLLASLVSLADLQIQRKSSGIMTFAGIIWLAVGLLVGISAMESLWIPFLLFCPFAYNPQKWKAPGTYGSIAATVPLFAMQDILGWILFTMIGLKIWEIRKQHPESEGGDPLKGLSITRFAMLAVALLIPFLMPLISWRGKTVWKPTGAQVLNRIDDFSYELKVIAQPPDLKLFCYLPMGDGRHHTLPVCMRYRGVSLKPASGQVMTDGNSWMKQYFFHGEKLISDYHTYVLRTFAPFSEAGIHLIVIAPVDNMDDYSFEIAADTTMERLFAR